MLQRLQEKLPSLPKRVCKEKTPKVKTGKKKKTTITVLLTAVLLGTALILPGTLRRGRSGPAIIDLSDTTVLRYRDMADSISATGIIESAHSTTVYSTLSYTVMGVYVELGDNVEEGQLLAELDSQSIQEQIESQEASMNDSSKTNNASIASAQHNYNQYKSDLDQGLNSSILSAENSVTSAYNSYLSAVNTYERYREGLETGSDSSITNAENSVTSAYNSYISAVNTYERYKEGLDTGTNSNILSAENSLTSAYNSYISALNTYDRYKEGLDAGQNTTLINQESSLRGAGSSLETARDSYNNALDALEDARISVNAAENDLANANRTLSDVKTNLANAQNTLENKQRELEQLTDDSAKATLEQEIASLTSQITQLEAAVTSEEAKVTSAQDALKQAESSRESCEQQVISARRSLENAEASYSDARATYDATVTSVGNTLEDYDTAVETAYQSYLSAQTSLENARKTCEDTLADYYTSMTTAYDSYVSAAESLQRTKDSSDDTLTDYYTSMQNAYESYLSAQTNLEATKVSAQNQLQSYQDSLNSAYASADKSSSEVSLRQLKVDLDSTQITAPCAGTVTAIYAEVGSGGSGLLFVIEDIDDLIVDTSIKEYDIGNIQLGTNVSISTDASKGEEITGVITRVAPTANKTSQGVTDTSSDAAFAAEVEITSQNTGLKIGMEAQLDYIIAEETHVLAAPYDAVYQNDQGKACVIAVEEQEGGTYLLKELPVTTGMDDDLDIVISGAGVTEGLRVVNEPDEYRAMIGQTIAAGKRPESSGTVAMGPMALMK